MLRLSRCWRAPVCTTCLGPPWPGVQGEASVPPTPYKDPSPTISAGRSWATFCDPAQSRSQPYHWGPPVPLRGPSPLPAERGKGAQGPSSPSHSSSLAAGPGYGAPEVVSWLYPLFLKGGRAASRTPSWHSPPRPAWSHRIPRLGRPEPPHLDCTSLLRASKKQYLEFPAARHRLGRRLAHPGEGLQVAGPRGMEEEGTSPAQLPAVTVKLRGPDKDAGRAETRGAHDRLHCSRARLPSACSRPGGQVGNLPWAPESSCRLADRCLAPPQPTGLSLDVQSDLPELLRWAARGQVSTLRWLAPSADRPGTPGRQPQASVPPAPPRRSPFCAPWSQSPAPRPCPPGGGTTLEGVCWINLLLLRSQAAPGRSTTTLGLSWACCPWPPTCSDLTRAARDARPRETCSAESFLPQNLPRTRTQHT